MGAVPSLLEFELAHGVHCVHEVLLTHPHFDHLHSSIGCRCVCCGAAGRISLDRCRSMPAAECWQNGPGRVHPYLAERSDMRPLQPGVPVMLGELTITPFAVNHGPKAPGALGFVVQPQRPEDRRYRRFSFASPMKTTAVVRRRRDVSRRQHMASGRAYMAPVGPRQSAANRALAAPPSVHEPLQRLRRPRRCR